MSAKTLYAYGSNNSSPTLGKFTANVAVRDIDKSCVVNFIVIDVKGHNLLGRDTARDLGFVAHWAVSHELCQFGHS